MAVRHKKARRSSSKKKVPGWPTTTLSSVNQVFDTLLELKGKRWLSRGQPKTYANLQPSIDRHLRGQSRRGKLAIERKAIDLFRHTARHFADEGEQGALHDDVIALMVLRHYGFPTRILDWSTSPYVAAYFAVSDDNGEDGELWSFDEPTYEIVGAAQWAKWPQTTVGNPPQFQAGLTAFSTSEPPDWFIVAFYNTPKFPRQFAQSGAYTMTGQFGRDHSDAIQNLFADPGHYHRFVIPKALKAELRHALRVDHGVWRGSLFPDSAGAVETALITLFPGGVR